MAVFQHLRMDCVHGELECLPTQLTCPGECSPGRFGEEGARCFYCSSPSPGEPVHASPVFVSFRGSCWLETVTGAKPPPTPRTRDLKEPPSSKPSRYISFPPPPLPCPPSQLACGTDPLAPSLCPVRLRGPRPAEERPALLRHQREGSQDRRVLLHAELHALLLLHPPSVPHRPLR